MAKVERDDTLTNNLPGRTMRNLFRTLSLTLAVLSATTSQAQAQRGIGTVETLVYVADFGASGQSLCHWVENIAFKRVPLTTESRGYVIAGNQCETEFFTPISTAEVQQAQINGLLDPNLPLVPKISQAQFFMNVAIFGGVGIAIIGALLVNFGLFRRQTRKVEKSSLLAGGLNSLRGAKKGKTVSKATATKAMAAMCFVAKCDGGVEGDEVMTIARMMKSLTGQSVPVAQVVHMLGQIPEQVDEEDYLFVSQGVKPAERHSILDAALAVAVADGAIAPAEYSVIAKLADYLDIKADEFRASLQRAAGHLIVHPT